MAQICGCCGLEQEVCEDTVWGGILGSYFGCNAADDAQAAYDDVLLRLGQAADEMQANGWRGVQIRIVSGPGQIGVIPPPDCEECCEVWTAGEVYLDGCCDTPGENVIYEIIDTTSGNLGNLPVPECLDEENPLP